MVGRWVGALAAASVGLVGCSGGDDPQKDDPTDGTTDGTTEDTGTDTDTDPTDPTADAVTFAEDVRPGLIRSCAQCHGASGLAPLDLVDFEVASAWAEVMLDRIDSGEMPPAMADADCHPYQGMTETMLDPGLRDALAAWIEDGKLPGDLDGTETAAPWSPPTLSRRDVELRPPAAVAPQFTDGNEYRCFLLDDGVDADTWVSGIEFLMDDPRISHHALLFVDPSGNAERNITDEASRSWTCPEVLPEPDWITAHAWAPGGGAVEFPEGMGLRVQQGQQLILQMHYWAGTAEPEPDLPGYALKLEATVEREMLYAPLGPDGFTIPAGAASHTESMTLPMFWLGGGAWEVYGVMPHMHVLGTGYAFYGTGGGNEKCISRSERYDFALQPTYWFDEPVRLEPSDLLHVECTWDNSADNPRQLFDPPQNVTWGENTQQEMCYALMYIAAAAD